MPKEHDEIAFGDHARARNAPGLPIVERDAELAELDRRFDAAWGGSGSIVVIDGPAGIGKTSLLVDAEALARASRVRIVRAHGVELERDFPFGVAIHLFESVWSEFHERGGALIEDGPTRLASALFDGKLHGLGSPFGDQEYPVIHGLFSFTRTLVTEGGELEDATPLAIIVDDVHWVDQPSLRFLAYCAARISHLPLVVVVALRSGEESTDRAALGALLRAPSATVLRPSELSRGAVERFVRADFPEADAEFIAACYEATRGNPFLLTELLSQLHEDRRRPDASTALRLERHVPDTIVDATEARLDGMSEPERALARAIAVLGDQASIKAAARLAELDARTATEAADSLAQSRLLAPGLPLSFIHPVIKAAVLRSLSPLARGRAHQLAAEILRDDGAATDVVADHLLIAPAEADEAAVDVLRAAAQRKLADGQPRRAVRLLARALDEPPSSSVHAGVLAELALARGKVLLSDAQYRNAAETFDEGLRELDSPDADLEAELNAGFVSAAARVPDLATEAVRRRGRIAETTSGEDARRRAALADTLVLDSLRGERRDQIRRRADLAWSDGSLLDADGAAGDVRVASLTGALVFVDELERATEIGDAILRRDPEAVPGPVVRYLRASSRYAAGDIDGAANDAEAALDAPDQLYQIGLPAYGTLAACHLLRGELDQAEMALTITDDESFAGTLSHPFMLDVRAQLRLAQHRHRDALQDALMAGESMASEFEATNPGAVAWRSTAALAELAIGNGERAEELAREEFELAQAIGVTRVVVRDLRVLGLIAGGNTGIELLEEAVRTASDGRPRLESTLALLDLGAALRRAKKRAAAREPLRKALELSHRGGASALEQRARSELAAAGARPRRSMLTGVASLTPGERRVAELAAQGKTTRMIAETLFITPKTVEFHLRNIYQKLDINSRAQLANVIDRGDRT